jgi:polyhydroxyalkanoate synthesis regulator phasin
MSFKKKMMEQGMKLLGDPRLADFMRDERVSRMMLQALSVPGKVTSFTQDQIEKLAKSMNLATEDEVANLRRTVRRLEEEMARMERDKDRRQK